MEQALTIHCYGESCLLATGFRVESLHPAQILKFKTYLDLLEKVWKIFFDSQPGYYLVHSHSRLPNFSHIHINRRQQTTNDQSLCAHLHFRHVDELFPNDHRPHNCHQGSHCSELHYRKGLLEQTLHFGT